MAMRWLLLLILTGSVATCGQKGPLEPPPAASISPSAQDAQIAIAAHRSRSALR